MPIPRLVTSRTALLVVDLQEKLLPAIHDADAVVQQCVRLIRGFGVLGLPVAVTEQYPAGLGRTVAPVTAVLPPGTPMEEKLKFSACIDPVRRYLEQANRTTVVLCGIEGHVCVMQTALELLELGYQPMIAVDAMGSRRPRDLAVAVERMAQAGVVPMTVEMALLELVREAGTATFKAMLPVVK